MAVDVATLVSEFPEFSSAATAQPAMVARALRLAQSLVDARQYGSAYQDAVFLLTADALAMSPYGESLRINVDGEPTSVYRLQYERLQRAKSPRVMLGGGLRDGSY